MLFHFVLSHLTDLNFQPQVTQQPKPEEPAKADEVAAAAAAVAAAVAAEKKDEEDAAAEQETPAASTEDASVETMAVENANASDAAAIAVAAAD